MAVKILVVDNDDDFVEATATVLKSRKFDVITANDGAECVTKAKAEKPELILLDIMMSYVSEGLDTLQQLRDDPLTSHIPVILVTGVRKAAYLPESYGPQEEWPNFKGVVEKPIKPDELLKLVDKALKK